MKAAAQVGLFVVVAVVLFLAGIAVVGSRWLGQKNAVYVVTMPDAGGLAKGARVLMAGVQVGEITKVGLASPTEARLEIGVDPKVRLPRGTRALLQGSLVGLGDSPIALVQDPAYHGPPGDYEPGMTIPGGKAGPLDSVLPDGGSTLYSNLNATLTSVRSLLQNNGLQKDVRSVLATTKQTMEASQDTLRAFTQIARRGDALVAQNQGQIAEIVRTAEGTLASVHETALTIERFAKAGKLQSGAEGLVADAHRIAVQSQTLLADLHRTIADEGLNRDLHATADNLAATSAKLPPLIDKTNRIATNVNALAEKSQDLPGKLGNVLDNAADLEKRLGGVADKFGGVLGAKPRALPPITTQLDLIHVGRPEHWRTDLNASVPISDGFVTVGLWDAFERNRVNLQLGRTLNPSLDYRYGIYAGRPGVGVDYAFTSKLGLRGDLWDINDPRLDARLRYEFGGGLIGWLGMDRLFQGPTLTIGVGVRR